MPVYDLKTLNIVGIEGIYINIIKATYDRPTAHIILSGDKRNAIPLKSGTRKECSLLSFLFNICWNFYPERLVKNVEGGHPNWNRSKTAICPYLQMTCLYMQNLNY